MLNSCSIGMRDTQLLKLVQILMRPECSIIALNLGETTGCSCHAWWTFAAAIPKTSLEVM